MSFVDTSGVSSSHELVTHELADPLGGAPISVSMPTRTQVDDLDIDAVRSALKHKILELRTAGRMKEAHAAAQVLSELG